MNYWLLKSEPTCYSIDDMARDKKADWTGIRNYQARNFMRDKMKVGDLALFYHSSVKPVGVAGIIKITGSGHPDMSALNPKDDHYEPKASKENPIWYAVEVSFIEKFKNLVTLDQIKFDPRLKGIMVASRGSRLSVQPVSENHFRRIVELSK